MKKIKQILAIVVCIFLVGLYAFSLILAILGNSNSKNLFFTSVYATVIIPIVIWMYTFIYKFFKSKHQENIDASKQSKEDDSKD